MIWSDFFLQYDLLYCEQFFRECVLCILVSKQGWLTRQRKTNENEGKKKVKIASPTENFISSNS